MEGLNKITEKIKKDAENEAKKIEKKREQTIKEIKENNKKILKGEEEELKKEVRMRLDLLKSKELSKARLEAKTNLLKSREKLIQGIVEETKKQVKKDYKKLIEKRLNECSSEKVEISCSSNNRKAVEEAVKNSRIEATIKSDLEENEVIVSEGAGKQTKIKVDEEVECLMPEIRTLIGGIIK